MINQWITSLPLRPKFEVSKHDSKKSSTLQVLYLIPHLFSLGW